MFVETISDAIGKEIPAFSEFKYWFVPVSLGRVDVYDVKTSSKCKEAATVVGLDMAEAADFDKFKNRPEYTLIESRASWEGGNLYDALLAGCILVKTVKENLQSTGTLGNPDDAVPRILRCLQWLHTTDFYIAPASTRYHDSTVGGLLNHSLKVADCTTKLLRSPIFNVVDIESAVLVALVHDWCKIGFYESYQKNVKNETTGVWEKQDAFRWKDKAYSCLGHGVSSMYIAQKFIKLDIEECLAIRWHMGAWRVCDSEINEMQQANEMYPLVHLLQFADQLSITEYA